MKPTALMSASTVNGTYNLFGKEIIMKQPLSNSFIFRTLDHYQPQGIAILSAEWDSECLCGIIRNMPYPFTKPGHIDYMTAAMAMLYVSQASYLNVRLLIQSNLLPKEVLITDDEFFIARDEGELVFTKVIVKFRRKIMISNGDFPFMQKISKIKKIRRHIYARFSCILANGDCMVSGNFAMPINR